MVWLAAVDCSQGPPTPTPTPTPPPPCVLLGHRLVHILQEDTPNLGVHKSNVFNQGGGKKVGVGV